MNAWLHAHSKYIAAGIAALIAAAASLGVWNDATWQQAAALIVSLGLGYLLPSPLSPAPANPPAPK